MLPVFLLGACTTVPPTNVHQPMSARPAQRPDALAASLAATGSIYQAGASRTLFEDRRARYVGDTITVTITENTSAATKSNNSRLQDRQHQRLVRTKRQSARQVAD
jgi:flagellar L-ring protein precursor FlgH